MPERILGTCDGCKTWYLFDGDVEYHEEDHVQFEG